MNAEKRNIDLIEKACKVVGPGNGHNHISELTHAMIGVKLGEKIAPRVQALQAKLGR